MTISGLDFGTSNSTIGVLHQGEPIMVPLEKDMYGTWQTTLPSALFFGHDNDRIGFGRDAIKRYTQGEPGRFMRSMKSLLGSSTMEGSTRVKNKYYSFDQIVGFFVSSLKQSGEKHTGSESDPLESVVMGRPVRFNDSDKELDRAAEDHLASIAKLAGFKHISFQFEPIAAALDYEKQVKREELALIIDIGGGTSDFTLIRLSPDRRLQDDRKEDLLGNHGIHIGGTDFDRLLSVEGVMPEFGLGMPMADRPSMEMPKHYFIDLATWHRIHLLYEPKLLRGLKQLRLTVSDKQKLDWLYDLLKNRKGHSLAALVEQAKIKLSIDTEALVDLQSLFPSEDMLVPENCLLTQTQLQATLQSPIDAIFQAVDETLRQSGLSHDSIDTVFTTGGSTALPMVNACIDNAFPHAQKIAGDLYNSVGSGLLIEAIKRYG